MTATFTPQQFKEARRKLGLSVSQAALMLGVSEIQIRRLETEPAFESHRPVNGTMQRLLDAYLKGYRPKDWPI